MAKISTASSQPFDRIFAVSIVECNCTVEFQAGGLLEVSVSACFFVLALGVFLQVKCFSPDHKNLQNPI